MKLLFRLIPATYSDATPKSGRLHVGISGRFASEWVAGFRRNARPDSSGIRKFLILLSTKDCLIWESVHILQKPLERQKHFVCKSRQELKEKKKFELDTVFIS